MPNTKKEFVTAEGQHWYPSPKKKETFYPSVTTVLSVYPKGVGFAKYLANQESWESSQEILDKAGKRGTRVHEATELLEQGEVLVCDNYSSDEWIMLQGFIDWHRKYNPKLILSEEYLVSDKLKTGGTADRLYMMPDGEYLLLDIKTSNKIHDNYWVQVAVYAKMFMERMTIIDKVGILRLRTLGKEKFEYVTMDSDEWLDKFELWNPLQMIWNAVNPNAKPKIVEIPLTLTLYEKKETTDDDISKD